MRATKKQLKHKKYTLGIILLIGAIIPSYYILKSVIYGRQLPDGQSWWTETLHTFGFTVIMASMLFAISTFISRRLEKVLPWREFARRRLFTQLFLIIVTTVVASAAVTLLWFTHMQECPNPARMIFEVATISLVVNVIANAVYEGAYLFRQWKEALVNTEKLKKENLQSQFDSLKSQVNPHFLFNSLNTLATIIPENQEQAVEFVQKLSSVYRYLLQYKDDETVDLKTELDCIDAYFFLQKIRFGDNLRVNINIPEEYHRKQIPPLTLQILVENAIKHNVISQQKPLKVDIYIDDAGMLVTRNNLQKKKSVESSTKIGLQNLMNRYTYIFGHGIDIFETDTDFIVKVPMG